MTKRRISASIDPDLLSAAEAAVKRRGSSNFSAWMAELVIRLRLRNLSLLLIQRQRTAEL